MLPDAIPVIKVLQMHKTRMKMYPMISIGYSGHLSSPLVMGQVHSPDARITAGVNIKLLEVTGLPHFDDAVVTSCHQILPVTAQQDGLQGKRRINIGNVYEMDACGCVRLCLTRVESLISICARSFPLMLKLQNCPLS